jgi:hypothetical protein
MEALMIADRYTKRVLTVIAAALVVLAFGPWLRTLDRRLTVGVPLAAAQTPPVAGAPALPTTPGTPWWDDCTLVSKATVPANWGKLVGFAPGVFVFDSDDAIRVVRSAPYEAAGDVPASGKPCKMLEIKRVK